MTEKFQGEENVRVDLSFEEMQKIPEITALIKLIESELYMIGHMMGEKEVCGGWSSDGGQTVSLNFNCLDAMEQRRAVFQRDQDGEYCLKPDSVV